MTAEARLARALLASFIALATPALAAEKSPVPKEPVKESDANEPVRKSGANEPVRKSGAKEPTKESEAGKPAARAANTGEYDSELSITRLDATVKADLERNAVEVVVTTTLRNTSPSAVGTARLAIGNTEQAQGMTASVDSVALVKGSATSTLDFWSELGPGREVYAVDFREPLRPGKEVALRWWYTLQGEPGRLVAPVPSDKDGTGEVYLIRDFDWLPVVALPEQPNGFPHVLEPEWRLRLEYPSTLRAVVDGARRGRTESDEVVSEEWTSIVRGWPQLLIGPYDVVESKDSRGPSIEWYLPRGSELQETVDDLGPKALRALQKLVGTYGEPGASTYRVVVSQAPWGAHGMFMGQVIESALLRELDLRMLAHEMAHTWFGSTVAPYHQGSLLLRDGLAELSAAHALRSVEGDEAYRALRRSWKIQAFCPYPASDEKPGAGALVEQPDGKDGDLQLAASTKGALVLDTIRAELGDERFFDALRQLVRERKGKGASLSHLLDALRDAGSAERVAAFRPWFEQAGYPSYAVESFSSPMREATEVQVTVVNRGTLQAPVPLVLRFNEGNELRQVVSVAPGERRQFKFPVPSRPRSLQMDPDLDAFNYSPRQAVPLWLGLDTAGFDDVAWNWFNASWARFQSSQFKEAVETLDSYLARRGQGRGPGSLDALGRDPLHACLLLWRARYQVAAGDETRARADAAAAVPGLAGMLRDPGLLAPARHAGLVQAAKAHAQLVEWLGELTGRSPEVPESADGAARRAAVDTWLGWWNREGRKQALVIETLATRLPAPQPRRTATRPRR